MQTQQLSRLVDALGTDQFSSALALWLHGTVTFDGFVVLAYPSSGELTVFHDGAPEASSISCNTVYRAGMWVLSPLYLQAKMGKSGFFHITDMCGPKFRQSRFYTNYYRDAGINDHVAYITQAENGEATVVSLERSAALPTFSAQEIDLLSSWEPLIGALVRKHGSGLRSDPGTNRAIMGGTQAELLRVLDDRQLTPREEEVILAVLRGLPNKLIARELGISVETVKVHCTKIMRKFEVSSRTALFSEIFKRVVAVPY